MKHLLVTLLLVALSLTNSASAGPMDDAKVLFALYVQLEREFDPAAADLYAEDALIKNKRT